MYQKQAKYKAEIEKMPQPLPVQEALAKYNAQKSRASKLLAVGKMPLSMYREVFELDEDQEKAIALYSQQQLADQHARDFLLNALEKYGVSWGFRWQKGSDTDNEDEPIAEARESRERTKVSNHVPSRFLMM